MAEKDFQKGLDHLAEGPASSGPSEGPPADRGDDLPPHPSITALRDRFGEAILRRELHAKDEHVVFVSPDRTLEIMRWLRDDPGQQFDFLADVTCVDFGGGRPIQVVYQLWSIPKRVQLRVKAELPLDALAIDSVVPVWQTANWLEREAYDMFGVQFRGHPDLRRILMPENYEEGHPLRKDFPLRGRFSRAEQTRRAMEMHVEDHYTPDELRFMEETGRPVEHPLRNAGVPGQNLGGIQRG